ncbi:MAG: DegT/DnrJ/EryC1/StrS family aminotransferase, partial [Hyphomicrobiales bacterium]|nr:DegT/DnrJ/EryC1/StrS family aminotransferase [Hyphomicrobiales bacterium]
DSIQAAILIEKLKIFPDEIVARDRIAARYSANLPAGLQAQAMLPGATSVWAQYTLVAEDRDRLRASLGEAGVPTAVYYPKPNHLQAPYLEAPRAPKGLPVTEHLQERVFSLPMHPYLNEATQDQVLTALSAAVG